MFAGFPELPLAPPADVVDEDFECHDEAGCVRLVPPAPVQRLRLTFAALSHLLSLSRQAAKHRAVFGRLCGLQLREEVTVAAVDANPTVPPAPEHETARQQQERRLAERRLRREAFAALDRVRQEEKLDTLQVGTLIIGSANFSVFSHAVLAQLMELRAAGKSAVLLCFDPFRTGLFGRPYLRAYVPTAEFLQYYELEKKAGKVGRDGGKENNHLKESGVTAHGALREVPVMLEVDPVQLLGLARVEVPPTQSNFSASMSDAAADYVTALVHSVTVNTDNLIRALKSEEYMNGKEGKVNAPLAQKLDTLLALQHLRDQTTHLEGICDSVLMNSSLLRDL